MNILVTGAKGFVGRNLVENLKTLQDGRNRTRPNLKIGEIYEYDLDSTPEELDAYCAKADFVFNLAGVNRPKDPAEFREGNFGFASTLLDALKRHHNASPVMLSSSIQATLAGRFGTSEYGLSKRDGEELFFFANDGEGNKQTWPFNKPFYLILNLAWGGDWGGAQGVDESVLPITMEVDYVRVFQKN